MAFKGDLKNISLFDVFQTLNTNQQTGVLVLQRDGVTKKVFIAPDGVHICFTRSFRPLRLGEIFARRGSIDAKDIEILLLEQKNEYRPMGQLLVESGKVPQEEVDAILRYHAEDEIYELFAWDHGTFAFYDGQSAEDDEETPLSEVILDPAGLCLEAARRMDEMEKLRERIPSNLEFFAHVESLEPDREQNTFAVLAVYDVLAHPNNVDDVRDLAGLSLLDVLRALVQLLEGGLIRPLEIDELLAAGRTARDEGRHERAAQLLDKAHAIDPANREVLVECIESMQRLNATDRLAVLLGSLGAQHLEASELDDAIETLEQALRYDSGNVEALTNLRDAFAQIGDANHAAETSLRLSRCHSDLGHLDEAIQAALDGVEYQPRSVGLRYYLGQLLLRADRREEAQEQLRGLVSETLSHKKAARSSKVQDLLASCYRLLLKLDPQDEMAHRGLRTLERGRATERGPRRYAVWGAIGAAAVLVVIGIGLVVTGPSAGDLLARAKEAHAQRNLPGIAEAAEELAAAFPGSPEAEEAERLRTEFATRQDEEQAARKEARARIQDEIGTRMEEVRAALKKDAPLNALRQVDALVRQLERPETAFLKKSMQINLEFALGDFLERIADDLDRDRGTVARIAAKMGGRGELDRETLETMVTELGLIRRKDWPVLVRDLRAQFEEITGSPILSKLARSVQEFEKRVAAASTAFAEMERMNSALRARHLKVRIADAVDRAHDEGRILLGACRFREARELYDTAWQLADSVADEKPREHYVDLLDWIAARNILADMDRRRGQVDEITGALDRIEILREQGAADQAYRLMRGLIEDHRIVGFEKKYKLPYLVRSTPQNARVLVDGVEVGRTPQAIELEITEPVVIRIERDGFTSHEEKIRPTDARLDGTLDASLRKEPAWRRSIGGAVEAGAAVAGGRVLIATSNASVVALELASGDTAWEAPSQLLDRIKARPLVAGDYVYFATLDGVLHQVSLRTGGIVDHVRLDGKVRYDGASDGTRTYFATHANTLVAVEGTKILYAAPIRHTPSTAVLHVDGELFVGTASGTILVHDAKNGEFRRALKSSGGASFFGGIALHGGLVVGGAEDGMLYAFDRATGKREWRFRTGGPLDHPPVRAGKLLYLGAQDGNIHGVDAAGNEQEEYILGGVAASSPVLVDGFLYAIYGRSISAFDAKDGTRWWDHTFQDETPIGLVASENGVVAITKNADRMYQVVAFSKDTRD